MNECRILVVEENADLAQVLRSYLQSQGYQVTVETQGSRAMEACREQRPDVLLLDIDLRETSGFSLYTQLRDDPQTAQIHIALLAQRNVDFDLPLARPESIFLAPFDLGSLRSYIKKGCPA